MRTGSDGRIWVPLEHPRPMPVKDRYEYWTNPPPARSERCTYWLRQIERGWLPNRRWRALGYDTSARVYGVWIWEYLNVIYPALEAARASQGPPS